MRQSFVAVGGVVAVGAAAAAVWLASPPAAVSQPPGSPAIRVAAAGQSGQPDGVQPGPNGKAGPALPISHVILFSSGVGYFQREGELDGPGRVDLTFPGADVNDLLKSLVLQDTNGGKVGTISYDSPDPIEKTLKSFALDLTYNPSFGQLVNQARGERVEITMQQSGAAQPGALTGVVLGMESQRQPHGKDALVDVEMLNLLCAEGVRSVPLAQVQRLRFLNPALEAELRRALEVLAGRHDSLKKVVSLNFAGEGKRKVKVGYVIENPIWKTSYRLVLDQGPKAFLQGWAVVENTSDDDWKDVRMALVSGRPISFKMDLYQPLFIPRPTVEPELFASLRPPTFNADLGQQAPVAGQGAGNLGAAGNLGVAGGIAGMGGFQGVANISGLGLNPNYANNSAFINRYNLNGQWGNLGGQMGLQGGGQLGLQGGQNGLNFNNDGTNNILNNALVQNQRLTYEELQKRQQELRQAKGKARAVGSALAAMNLQQGVESVASAEEVGDYFQYVIDHKVSLPRQKSALLPIVNDPVEAVRVSIYNESVQPKFPLLGLKLKNTSGQNLMQGPITVYEGSTYAGDTRIMDLQPGEERLVAYALDQGTEVKAEGQAAPQQLVSVRILKGAALATSKFRETKTYLVKNRSPQDRTLVIEHPVRPEWTLVTPDKPRERSRDVYRFEVQVGAGKSVQLAVVEEQSRIERLALGATDEKGLRIILSSPVVSPRVKEALQQSVALKTKLSDTQREIGQLQAQLKAITDDQIRLRSNFERLPPTSAAYKRYLEKFDTQETEIEKLQEQIKKLQESEKTQQKAYEDFLAALTVE